MAREKICGIYKIENLVNGKVYIGQSVDIYARWVDHKKESQPKGKLNYPLYRAFRKYGVEHFSFEILEKCSEDELNDRERYFIEFYRSYIKWENSNGYNQTLGGEGTRGFGLNGDKNPMYGKHRTEEEKRKIREARKGKYSGENHPMYGIPRTEETKEKIRNSWTDERKEYYKNMLSGENNPMYGKHHTEEEKKKIGLASSGGNNPMARKVICEGKIFSCITECAEYYGLKRKRLSRWLNGTNNMPQEFKDKGLKFYKEVI